MTDEQSIDSEFIPTDVVAEATSNGTGEHAETAAEAAADSPPDGEAISAVAESVDSGPGEAGDDAGTAIAEAESTTDPAQETASDTAAAEATDTAAADATSGTPDFLAQLVNAMRATADAERARAADDIERRRAEYVARIEQQRDAEAARMRELADEDRRAIDAWAETERQRIEAERQRQTDELEADLTRSLAEHADQIDGRIQAIEEAVKAHRVELDAFFAALDAESDPVRIAEQARRRPAFPDLDAPVQTADASPAEPTTIDEPVGVMDPVARLGLSGTPDDAVPARDQALLQRVPAGRPVASTAPIPSVPAPSSSPTPGWPEEPSETRAERRPEPVASGHGGSSGLNPMGWLRRGNDQGDR